jgi:hypothetical protein
MRDDELFVALATLGDHIEYPRTADLSGAVVSRLRSDSPRTARHRVRAIAIAVVAAALAVLVLPAPRHAVADWLGFSTVHIVRVDSLPPDLGSRLQLGRRVALDEARGHPPFTVMAPSTLDDPVAAFVDEPVNGAVTLVWPPTGQLPAVGSTGVGLLLSELPGSVDQTLLEKRLGPSTSVEVVDVGGTAGYWIAGGPHELMYLAPNGAGRPDTSRLAANTLIWSKDGVVYRMESALDRSAAVELASSLAPL